MVKQLSALAFLASTFLLAPARTAAQDAIVQEGELGIGLGAAHYFGDLNTRAKINRPKMAATVFVSR
jgi:hypothetical protein